MSLSEIFGWLIVAVVFAGLLPYLIKTMSPKKKVEEPGLWHPEHYEGDPRLAASVSDRFREVGTYSGRRFEPAAARTLRMSPRNLSHVNSIRRARGRAPLNYRGFKTAIASAPLTTGDHNDWLQYLIMYEVLFADHTGRTPDIGIAITTEAPYNGQGGAFGGAGASGGWDAPSSPAPAQPDPAPVPDYSGVGLLGDGSGPGTASTDPSPAPAPSVDSSPAPSYTPDPTPSPSYDSSPAPSFDSSSSSAPSFDSSSS